jgi:chromosome partitioning protein
MLQHYAHDVNADFVFVDLGPSPGALNELFVLSSHFVIPPSSPDQNAFHSTRGLFRSVLPRWFEDASKARRVQDICDPARLGFPRRDPLILSVFASKYWVTMGQVTGSAQNFLRAMTRFIQHILATYNGEHVGSPKHRIARAFLPLGGREVIAIMRNMNNLEKTASRQQRAVHEVTPRPPDVLPRIEEDNAFMGDICTSLCLLRAPPN